MPVKKLIDFFGGSCRIEICEGDAAAVLNIFLKHKFIYRSFRVSGGVCSFNIPLAGAKRFSRVCGESGVDFRIAQKRGLPVFLARNKRRAGVPVGLALFFIILRVSCMFVWEIEVRGNETLTRAQVVAELERSGFGVGSYIPALDLDLLHNTILLDSEDISWLSININGSYAEVLIREIRAAPPPADERPANLIAAADGQIELLELYAGQPAVKPGDTVRAGDLLVSGLIESGRIGFRTVRSGGKVYARTLRTLTVEIPFEYEKKHYTGVEKSNKSIKFFAKVINIFTETNNLPDFYDKIEEVKPLSFFDAVSVPVCFVNERYREYTTEICRRSETEALELAYYELRQLTDDVISGAQLLRKSIASEITDSAVILTCELFCLEDIAQASPFEIVDVPRGAESGEGAENEQNNN